MFGSEYAPQISGGFIHPIFCRKEMILSMLLMMLNMIVLISATIATIRALRDVNRLIRELDSIASARASERFSDWSMSQFSVRSYNLDPEPGLPYVNLACSRRTLSSPSLSRFAKCRSVNSRSLSGSIYYFDRCANSRSAICLLPMCVVQCSFGIFTNSGGWLQITFKAPRNATHHALSFWH